MRITKNLIYADSALVSARKIETGLVPAIPVSFFTFSYAIDKLEEEFIKFGDFGTTDFPQKHSWFLSSTYTVSLTYVEKATIPYPSGEKVEDILYLMSVRGQKTWFKFFRKEDNNIMEEFRRKTIEDMQLGEPVLELSGVLHMYKGEQIDIQKLAEHVINQFLSLDETPVPTQNIVDEFRDVKPDATPSTYYLLESDDLRISISLINPDPSIVWDITYTPVEAAYHMAVDFSESQQIAPFDNPTMQIKITLDRNGLPFYGEILELYNNDLETLLDTLCAVFSAERD